MRASRSEEENERAAKYYRRHFLLGTDFQVVGDRHSKSLTVKFLTGNSDASALVARLGPTTAREMQAYQAILGMTATEIVRVPSHSIAEPGVLIREFVPGCTLSQLNVAYVSAMESVGFLRLKAGLPADVVTGLTDLVFGPRLDRHRFYSRAISVFSGWSQCSYWMEAVARHLNIPLHGEAARKPLDLLYQWHTSPVRLGQNRGRPTWNTIRFSMAEFLQPRFPGLDLAATVASIYRQVDEVRTIAKRASLYDIHYDNIILDDTGKIHLIDLECAGLGYADFAETTLHFLEDLKQNGLNDTFPVWAGGWRPIPRTLAESVDLPLSYTGEARIILCGTSTYLRILRTALETIFFVFAFRHRLVPELDASDRDIISFPEPWRSFQKLKRLSRGCCLTDSSAKGQELEWLLRITIYGNEMPGLFAWESELDDFRTALRHNTYRPQSIAHWVALRAAEFLRFLPFELLLNRDVRKVDFDRSLRSFGMQEGHDELGAILVETTADLLAGVVPYHLFPGDRPFRIERRLMQRVRRKNAIVEMAQSKRSEHWLNQIIESDLTRVPSLLLSTVAASLR